MAPPLACGPGALQRRLLQAAAEGNLQLFKRTLSALDGGKGRLRDAVEVRGAGALHVAASRGRMAVCVYLVEELRVDVDAADESGDTPLAHAIRAGTVDTSRYLLDHGANPDKPDEKGSTPLHLAAAGGNCEIVKALLSKGANVDSLCDTGTPLHMAAFYKQDGAMKILLDHHADCNKLLNKAGADMKGVGTVTPLIIAANNGLTDCYKCLLDAGADPDVRDDFGHLPIEIAAYNNRRKDVEILLPVTSRTPYVQDWSVDGIIRWVKSMPSVENDPMNKMNPADLKLEGSKAYKRKDYATAVKLYSMAADRCPDDATLYSNRSLCWLKMGEGDQALMDAGICKITRPGWAKACHLEGSAQMLLRDYEKACDAFLDGLKLDPANVEIENSLRQCTYPGGVDNPICTSHASISFMLKHIWEALNCLKTSHAPQKL